MDIYSIELRALFHPLKQLNLIFAVFVHSFQLLVGKKPIGFNIKTAIKEKQPSHYSNFKKKKKKTVKWTNEDTQGKSKKGSNLVFCCCMQQNESITSAIRRYVPSSIIFIKTSRCGTQAKASEPIIYHGITAVDRYIVQVSGEEQGGASIFSNRGLCAKLLCSPGGSRYPCHKR